MENDKAKQTVLIVVLEDAGHLAKEASNAEDALRLIHEDGITLVVTDIDMPGAMDGLVAKCARRGRMSP